MVRNDTTLFPALQHIMNSTDNLLNRCLEWRKKSKSSRFDITKTSSLKTVLMFIDLSNWLVAMADTFLYFYAAIPTWYLQTVWYAPGTWLNISIVYRQCKTIFDYLEGKIFPYFVLFTNMTSVFSSSLWDD